MSKTAPMRRLVPLTFVLTMVAQLAQAAHFVLVAHTFCAEHGELVHGVVHSHADHAGRALGDAGEAAYAVDAADHHTHDHCPVCEHERQRITPARIDNVAMAARLVESPIPDCGAYLASRDILTFAPKSSPPFVAD